MTAPLIFLTVTEAGLYTRNHRETIAKALRDGSLHGTQRKAGKSDWIVQQPCLDAWKLGVQCGHRMVEQVAA